MFSVELRVTFPLLLTISIDSCCWDLINLLMKTFLSPGEISCWSSSFWPVKSLSLAGEILNSCGLTSYFPTFSDIFRHFLMEYDHLFLAKPMENSPPFLAEGPWRASIAWAVAASKRWGNAWRMPRPWGRQGWCLLRDVNVFFV